MVAAYYWSFLYIKQALALLSSTPTKEEYNAGLALLPPFNKECLVHPPDYSKDESVVGLVVVTEYWRLEFERVEKELTKELRRRQWLRAHSFGDGISRSLFYW
jgi:hypothetical protein